MIELNGKKICENCFSELEGEFCSNCGYNAKKSSYDPMTLKPGSILRGKYIVGKCLGKGGFGITYLAYDTKVERMVAIKEFFPFGQALRTEGNPTVSVSTEENAVVFKTGAEKFYEEAKLVSRFNGNPNIVSVYEFFYENDTVYFSMEFLKGRTLKDYVQNVGKLTAAQAHLIALNVSNALMAAHSASVLHRDISPDNIMLCNNGEIKLIDFGAARQVIAEQSQNFSVILKPGFAPLEQYQKKGQQGAWTDIYSLGASLFYAMTGIIPEDPMSRIDTDETFDSNKYGINDELWDIIVKATALKIRDRYQDVYELRRDLSALSFSAEPFIVPEEEKTESAVPTFRTATVRTARTAEAAPAASAAPAAVAVQPAPAVPVASEQKNDSRKKVMIGAICGGAAVAVAAIAVVVGINLNKPQSGNMVDKGEMNNTSAIYISGDNSSDSSQLEEPGSVIDVSSSDVDSSEPQESTSVTDNSPESQEDSKPQNNSSDDEKPAVTTPKTTTTKKPVVSEPEEASKPEVDSKPQEKPAETTPKTTTTKKPVESKPEEVKEVTICGQKISTDITELRIVQRSRDDQTFLNGILYCDPPTNKEDFAQLKYMKNLEKLELLEMGSVTDISFLEEIPKLTDLAIENDNQITDISAIGKLTNLKKLSLGYSQKLSDISVLGKLTQLETLSLRALSKVNDLSSLGTLTNLKDFETWDIPYNNISFLKKMTNLTSLKIDYTNIDGTIKDISVLSNLKNLDYLSLSNLPITDISALSELKKLTRLNMTSCSNVKSFTPLSKLKSLTFLRLFRNKITDPSFAYGLTNLETLWLTGEINDRYADKNVIADCDMKTLKSKLPKCDVH